LSKTSASETSVALIQRIAGAQPVSIQHKRTLRHATPKATDARLQAAGDRRLAKARDLRTARQQILGWASESPKWDDGVTLPDGFYVCELTRDGFIVQSPSGGDAIQGPYASAKKAKRETKREMAKLAKIGEELVREGRVRREVGDDGVVRFQAIVTKH
jgi:hypothetical protein